MKIKIINFSDIPDKNEYVGRFNETFGRNTPTEEYVSWYESEAWNIPTKVVAVFSDADEMLSAAVLFFKRLKICGEIRDVGVMCGAWTLPQFRGCGHMRKMIAATVENFGANGIRYMCGFGLMSNVSSRFERGRRRQPYGRLLRQRICRGIYRGGTGMRKKKFSDRRHIQVFPRKLYIHPAPIRHVLRAER